MQLLLGFFVVQFCGFESLEFFFIFSYRKISQIYTKKRFIPQNFSIFLLSPTGENSPQRKKKPLNLLYVLASYCQIVTFALGCLGS
jgi:hypothetical protein